MTTDNTLIYYAWKVPTKGNNVKVEYNNSTSSKHFEFKDAKEYIKGGRLDELYSVIQPRLPRMVTAAALVRKKEMASIRRQLPMESKWARQSWPRPRQLMIRLISLLRWMAHDVHALISPYLFHSCLDYNIFSRPSSLFGCASVRQ